MKPTRFPGLFVLFFLLILPLITFEAEVPVGAEKTAGSVATVHRGKKEQKIYSTADTVRDALEGSEINSVASGKIFPASSSEFVDGMNIFLPERSNTTLQPAWKGEPDRRIIKSRALPRGREIVIQGGGIGEEAPSRVLLRGQTEFKNRQLEKLRQKGTTRVLATAYSPHWLDTAPYTDGLSAIGVPAGYGIVAVDPRVIPLGTLLYVEGYGYGIAADVGGDIRGKRIDLCFPHRDQALLYGRQFTTVHIIG